MKRIIFILFLIHNVAIAKGSFQVAYLVPIFGNIHKNMHVDSKILSTISCGHPVRAYLNFKNKNWWKIKSGPYIGYLRKIDISFKKKRCFQDKYPKYFNKFNFTVEELYLWGKLNDRYVKGQVRFK